MYKVNNKKCINNLAFKSFKANKTRNIVAIIAIALTTLLFTSVFTIGAIFIHSYEQYNFKLVGGYAHGSIKNVSYEDIEILKEHSLIDSYGVSQYLGELDGEKFAKTSNEIKYIDPGYAKFTYTEFIEGGLPKENTKEIAADTNVLHLLGVEPVIGSEIKIDYTTINGKKISDTFILSGYFEPKDSAFQIAFLHPARSYVEKVIAENSSSDSNSIYGQIDMEVLLSSSYNIEKDIQTILEQSGFQYSDETLENYRDYGVNFGYTSSQVAENFDIGTIMFSAVLFLLFIVSGYLIIFNVFKISVTNDIRFYGLLKTIGATSAQIKRIIYKHAWLLALIGIPIGLILGYIVGCAIAPMIMTMVSFEFMGFTANPLIFVGGTVFSAFTLMISYKTPAKIASKVSPIEAMRFTEIKATKKNVRKKRRMTPFNIAMANMTRAKGKLIFVVISLSLSILILQITVMFTNGFDMDKYLQMQSSSDFLVAHTDYFNYSAYSNKSAIGEVDAAMLKAVEGVENSSEVYGVDGGEMLVFDVTNGDNENITLYAMNNTALEKLNFIDGDIGEGIIAEGIIAEGIIALYSEDDYGNVRPESGSSEVGDKIDLRFVEDWVMVEDTQALEETKELLDEMYSKYENDEEALEKALEEIDFSNIEPIYTYDLIKYTDKNFEVVATATIPNSMSYRHFTNTEYYILPYELFPQAEICLFLMNLGLDVSDDKIAEVDSFIKNYTEQINPTLNYESRESLAEGFAGFKNIFLTVGMFLSLIIGFIGILNFFNVVLTSITMRKKEFAIMQSIGLTGKQLKQTLIFESISYIILTGILTIVLALTTMPMVSNVISGVFWFFTANFTITPMLITLPIMLIIGISIPLVIYKMISRISVIDRLREIS